jgi:dUTP pyrophosphatase
LTVLIYPGTFYSYYRGEIKFLLVNLSNEVFEIQPGERIAQMVVSKHEIVEWQVSEELASSERGAGGYGSTGKK